MSAEQGAAPGTAAWEGLCRRCGASCHFAVRVGRLAVILDELRCRYLERADEGYRCSVYERRFEVAPWCHRAEEAAGQGLLAVDCPYAAALRGESRPAAASTLAPAGKSRVHPRLLTTVRQQAWAVLVAQGAPDGAREEGLHDLARAMGHDGVRWERRGDPPRWFPCVVAPTASGEAEGASREAVALSEASSSL